MSMLSVGLGKLGKGAKKLATNPVKWAENAGRSVGKAASDAAPLVGLIPGVGTLYGASIGALGSVAAGNNARTSLSKGIQGGLSGYANTHLLGGQGFKGIPSALHMGGSAAESAATTTQPMYNEMGDIVGSEIASGPAPSSSGLLSKIGSGAGRVASFAEEHPNAAGMALQGAGSALGSGSEHRLNDEQARALQQRTDESSYDFEQRKRREELMKPIWSALSSGLPNYEQEVAPNPYAR